MWLSLVLTSLFSFTHASEIDAKLQQYIKDFDLKPLDAHAASTPEKLQLGHMLFTDRTLSGNKNISCVECHHPSVMTHDGLPLAIGEGARGLESQQSGRAQADGHIIARNSPALLNLSANLQFMFWDGRVSKNPNGTFTAPVVLGATIEKTLTNAVAAQALFPMVDHLEMRGQVGTNEIADAKDEHEAWELIVKRLMAIPRYQKAFAAAFPGETINIGHVGEAIAAFEIENFYFADTAYDRYLRGDLTAMTPAQKLGMEAFFNKGKCGECHKGQNLAVEEFHNIGTPQIGPGKIKGDDFGRFAVVGAPENLYAFRVPALRNVSMTAPYMHNGAFKTLAQVVEHYDDIEASLREYKLVNNWKNYVDIIRDHDHTSDDLRLSHLSTKLTSRLNFEETDEKAIAEFLRGALTDTRFLAREISDNYRTYARFQLQPSGFEKLLKAQVGYLARTESYYYFDLLMEGGFALRELEQPVRLIVVKNNEGSQLIYRRQFYKQGLAQNNVLSDVAFNRTELAPVSDVVAMDLTSAYDDMFDRMYTYVQPGNVRDIPVTELNIIKNDVEAMNEAFHKISFAGLTDVSDQMNINRDELFFVPTSVNTKETYTADIPFRSTNLNIILQKSIIRDEEGGFVTTWAVEFETEKVLKKDMAEFQSAVFDFLQNVGIVASDVGGSSPSPSKTTERILNQIYP